MKYTPDSESRSRNYMQGWFIAMVTHLGLERAGRDLNRESFVAGLEKIRNYDTSGICGVINYSPSDHKSIEENRLYKADVEKKILVPITGWRKPPETKE